MTSDQDSEQRAASDILEAIRPHLSTPTVAAHVRGLIEDILFQYVIVPKQSASRRHGSKPVWLGGRAASC